MYLKIPEECQEIVSTALLNITLTPEQTNQLKIAFEQIYNKGINASESKITEKLSELNMKVDELISNPKQSYADKLRNSTIQQNKSKINSTTSTAHVLLIYPKDESIELKLDMIKNSLKVHLSTLQIRRLHTISKKGILVELNSKTDLNKVQDILTKELVDMAKFINPTRRIPELRIKNIGKELSEKEIIDLFQTQNKIKLNATPTGKKCFIKKTSFGRTDAVVLVSNPDFSKLLRNGKAFLGSMYLEVCENFRISTCIHCLNTGHKADQCPIKHKTICKKCGEEHNSGECNSKSNSCWRCAKYTQEKTIDHMFGSDNCVLFQNEKTKLIAITNYES